MNLRRAFAFPVLVAAVALPCAVRGDDTQSLVEARAGSMAVILAVPHDGAEPVPGVPPRSGGTTVRDLHSGLLATRTADLIEGRTGRRPYLLIARFSRKYIDANRAADEAVDSPEALPAYRAYHAQLASFVAQVRQQYPGGAILIDVHGQGAEAGTVFRGTRDGLTAKALVARHGEDAILGPGSLIGMLRAMGHTVHPAAPGMREDKRFGGGYTVATYGSHHSNGIDAVQLEFGKRMRDDPRAAEDFANAILGFEQAYLPVPKAQGR